MCYACRFYTAIATGDTGELSSVLQHYPDLVHTVGDQYGYGPMTQAIRAPHTLGKLPILELLLQHGANVNERTGKAQCTPLSHAAYRGDKQVQTTTVSRLKCLDCSSIL
jgi:Ankyrin repeats (many copies)